MTLLKSENKFLRLKERIGIDENQFNWKYIKTYKINRTELVKFSDHNIFKIWSWIWKVDFFICRSFKKNMLDLIFLNYFFGNNLKTHSV